jgi:hypothetical protein
MPKESRRRFPPPWRTERNQHGFVVLDANGLQLASVYCRDDLHENRWDDYKKHLTSDEARRIAKGIARLPELLRREPEFEVRYVSTSPNRYWKPSHPYHVALYDPYIRENFDMLKACCAMNRIPYEPTGESISPSGCGTWRTFQFAKQLHALQFWNAFQGRWMLGDSFYYPERPKDLPKMKGLDGPFGAFI